MVNASDRDNVTPTFTGPQSGKPVVPVDMVDTTPQVESTELEMLVRELLLSMLAPAPPPSLAPGEMETLKNDCYQWYRCRS